MKKVLLICSVLIAFASFKANAQLKIGVNINIGSQPEWGPVGYDYVDNYYMPDIECYYNVPRHQYIYLSNGRWVFAASLPSRYSNYDIYNGYKVVINEPRPYLHFQEHRVQYARYRGWQNRQPIIRESDDERYRGNGHDNGRHNGWYKDHGDNGKHKGWGKHDDD